MAKLVTRGILQGISIDVDSLPEYSNFAFVRTFQEHRYRVCFQLYVIKSESEGNRSPAVEQFGNRSHDVKRMYSVNICSLRNMSVWHDNGKLCDLVTDMEKISICQQCKFPMQNGTLCKSCITQNCFVFDDGAKADDCPICLHELKGPTSMIFTTECGHVFHARCFTKIKVKGVVHLDDMDDDGESECRDVRECPTCKEDVVNSPMHGEYNC